MRNFCLLLFGLGSCFLVSKYKRTNFSFSEGSQFYEMPVLIPKGYTKERTEVDSSGNTILSYFYKDEAVFYIAHLADSTVSLQPIIEEENIPRVSLASGAYMYKGMDEHNLYWREVRKKDLRIGYRSVSRELEGRFDEAANYAVAQNLRKD